MNIQGSEWRKWNFHCHTKGTNKNDLFVSATMDDFFLTFFKKAFDTQTSAIGVTDYFSIDRYLDSIDYRNTISSKKNEKGEALFTEAEIEFIKQIFIFPNVELRMLPSTDNGRLINIHCLFNPTYVADLENDFFAHISNQDGIKMNKYGIMSYGKNLDPQISDPQSQYIKGVNNFVIDLKSLKELIDTNKRFKENTILVVSNSNKDGASALQKHYDLFENEEGTLDGLRKSIYSISNAIFSANPKDIKYFVGKRLEGTDGYNDSIFNDEVRKVMTERGSLKPCIVGCDAHKETDLFSRFTWVKSDLNFEGLRQICFEPEQRVKIQSDKPDFKEEKLLIEKVCYISPKSIFSNKPIFLNPNLNVIIGGKSSGKSILLYSIAKTLLTESELLNNDDGTPRYDLTKMDDGFDFEIRTKGGFNQRLNRPSTENSILPEIKYIPQNYLVKLAEPDLSKKGKSLNKLVRDLIVEEEESREIYSSFTTKLAQNDKLRNTQIDLYFETIREIQLLEEELKTKSNKEVLEKNIETNIEKVEELNKSSGLTPEQVEEYKALQIKLEENKASQQKFRTDFSTIQGFDAELLQSLKNISERKQSVLNSLQLPAIQNYYSNLYSKIDVLYTDALSFTKESQTEKKEDGLAYLQETSFFNKILLELNSENKELTSSMDPYLKDEQIKKAIEVLNTSIAADKKSVLDIVTLTNKIQEKKQQLGNAKVELFKLYETNYNDYVNVIASLKSRTVELEKDGLNILGKAQFNFPKLRNDLFAISDGRTASYSQFGILSQNKKATDESVYPEIVAEIEKLFDDIVSGKYVLTTRSSIINAVKLILTDYFFDFWEITYKNDRLGEMSTGKASFVILMLIIGLSKSKAPILIDQPEDNLDNRSITSDLVNYLRSKKLERQIIIVTHNANIVVNADAENIIVANQKGQNDQVSTSQFKFDYINGAIENSFERLADESDLLKSMGIRQHIADIVEGGKDAFIMREKKYRFN